MAGQLKEDLSLIQETALVLSEAKAQGDALIQRLDAFTITTPEHAIEIRKGLDDAAAFAKKIEATRKRRVGPLNSYVDDTNAEYFALFKDGEKTPTSLFGRIITACKLKLLAWDQEQARLAAIRQAEIDEAARKKEEAERAKLDKKVEKAEARGRTDLANELREQSANVSIPAPVITTPVKTISTRTDWTFEVVDKTKVPEKYKLVDMATIGKVVGAEKSMCEIPGIRVFSKQIPVR